MLMNLKTIADDLLPVYETDKGNRVVDARELHEQLVVSTRYNDWINRMIEKYGFVENEDFYSFLSKTNGRPSAEYLLTLDTAKEIAMVQNNEAGRAIRKYFIDVEKQHRQAYIDTSNLSPELQMVNQIFHSLAQQELESKRMQKELETTNQRVDTISHTIKLNPINWRKSVNDVMKRIGSQPGQSYQDIRVQSYDLLEARGKCKLDIRLENMKRRLALEGASKSRIQKANKMDVIEEDERLKQIYLSIIKEFAIKYNVNMGQLEEVR